MAVTSTKKMHIPLPDDMHNALFTESRRAGVPATRLVRSILEDWLRQRRRERRREEIRQFATEHAGSELDLDPQLEVAAIEELDRFYEDENEAR